MYRSLAIVAALVLTAVLAHAGPVQSSAIRVIDGDTVEARGAVVRLVGYDTPETGSRAQCALERDLGAMASARLAAIVAGGRLDLELVRCSCRAGTEGTSRCNRGRRCGVLKAHGRDIGAVLIAESLARPFRCGLRSCPKRAGWCN